MAAFLWVYRYHTHGTFQYGWLTTPLGNDVPHYYSQSNILRSGGNGDGFWDSFRDEAVDDFTTISFRGKFDGTCYNDHPYAAIIFTYDIGGGSNLQYYLKKYVPKRLPFETDCFLATGEPINEPWELVRASSLEKREVPAGDRVFVMYSVNYYSRGPEFPKCLPRSGELIEVELNDHDRSVLVEKVRYVQRLMEYSQTLYEGIPRMIAGGG
jgi:hypothetical protein